MLNRKLNFDMWIIIFYLMEFTTFFARHMVYPISLIFMLCSESDKKLFRSHRMQSREMTRMQLCSACLGCLARCVCGGGGGVGEGG